MQDYDLSEPVEISADTYWVSQYGNELLERNIYLRVFKGGQKRINLIIDPGPPKDLQNLIRKVSKIIGDFKNINLIFINHQDPDVGYNASTIQKLNKNALVLASEDAFRLIKFYGLDEGKFKAIESFKDLQVTLSTGHILKFVPSPYCHFRGSVMLYDPETRILFSGDLFGGLSFKNDLFAEDGWWEGIKVFHQIYMPTKDALKYAMENIKKLDPPPLFICPQHGSIISGDKVKEVIQLMENLDVGLDLYLKRSEKQNYIFALNEVLNYVKGLIDKENLDKILKFFSDTSFTSIFSMNGNEITDIKVDLFYALEYFVKNIRYLLPKENLDVFDAELISVLIRYSLPVPSWRDTEPIEVELF